MRSWRLAALMLAVGVAVGAGQDTWVSSVVGFLAFAAVAVLFSPLAFPRSLTAAQARRRSADDGRPVIY
ncbi:hypothetical protein ACFYON_10125 [Micromonospora sp. NPDC005686]|uniref:hypothetical protein n=1 Tax=unclassified Micromonospora TaxID=2617518 RepID=UPI0033BDE737